MNQIMILGTFHMEGSSDIHGQAQRGILSKRRQAEIQELIDDLKIFCPTKIAVEVEKKNQTRLNQRYHEYQEDMLELTENEVHQLGFRLAKQLGHEEIYCVDWMEQGASTRGCGEVCEFLEEKEPALFEEVSQYENEPIMLDDNLTIQEAYRRMNNKDYVENMKAYYVNYARIGTDEDYYGMGWLTWWYQRNLIIFANLAELVENYSDERILLIIGSAHKGLLEEMLKDSKLFDVVEVLDYLGEAKSYK